MDIDDARLWLEALAENLLDANYTAATDSETHHKLAAIQVILARHEKLETGLVATDRAVDEIHKVIGPLL